MQSLHSEIAVEPLTSSTEHHIETRGRGLGFPVFVLGHSPDLILPLGALPRMLSLPDAGRSGILLDRHFREFFPPIPLRKQDHCKTRSPSPYHVPDLSQSILAGAIGGKAVADGRVCQCDIPWHSFYSFCRCTPLAGIVLRDSRMSHAELLGDLLLG